MDIKDFTEHEQKQINEGLTTSVITDKEAAKKILELVPSEWIKKIPFLVRAHATTRTVARVAKQYPELYAVAKQEGPFRGNSFLKRMNIADSFLTVFPLRNTILII